MKEWLKSQANHANANSLASRFRRKRARYFVAMCRRIIRRKGECNIVDLGGKVSYWQNLPSELNDPRIRITIVNLENAPAELDPRFRFVQGDATRIDLADMSFDLAHSNSVIEHLGSWEAMANFAREVRRLAPAYYVQTPNFWFPMEPHTLTPFFHWLPEPSRVALLLRNTRGHIKRAADVSEAMKKINALRLLDERALRFLFPDGEIRRERLLLVKSLIMVRDVAVSQRSAIAT